MVNALADETRSILFSSHNTLDVEQISDYITFIYGGRILESANKEDFMDGWRRLRLTNVDDKPLPAMANIRDIQKSGRLCTVVVNAYDDSLPGVFTAAGLTVTAVERLTLEEIFLVNVKYARARASAPAPMSATHQMEFAS